MSSLPENTHADDCWSWGLHHYECATAQVRRLEERLRLAELAARMNLETIRSMQREQNNYDGAPYCQYCNATHERDCKCGPIADNN